MDSYKRSLESLSQSLDLSWKNGDLLKWIIEGISDFRREHYDVLERAFKLLDGTFPTHVLKGDKNETPDQVHLKLSLFMAYFASVKHNWQPMKQALLGLKLQDQRSIERMFSLILEEKWNDPLFKETLELEMLEASRPLPCPTTPINRFKNMKKHTSPSSFKFSPNSPSGLPLKDFFTSPVTAQISKYQKIAEEKTKLLRATRLELDYEKVETFNLARERDEWIKERKNLRKSLESVRSNLYSNQWSDDDNETEDCSPYQYLRKTLADKKDGDNYIIKLEEQLQDTIDEKNELICKIESQCTKLQESSSQNSNLQSRLIELQTSLSTEKELTKDLVAKCEDFDLQVSELREIIDSRQKSNDEPSNAFVGNFENAWSVFPGASIGDISMDDHLVSMEPMCHFPRGENMAETLVIPELEEKIYLLNEQLDEYKDKYYRLEEELGRHRTESEHFKGLCIELSHPSKSLDLEPSTSRDTQTENEQEVNIAFLDRSINYDKCDHKSQISYIMSEIKSLTTIWLKLGESNEWDHMKSMKIADIHSLVSKIEQMEACLNDYEFEPMNPRFDSTENIEKFDHERFTKELDTDAKASDSRIMALEIEKNQATERMEMLSSENESYTIELDLKSKEIQRLKDTILEYKPELLAHHFEINSMQGALFDLKQSKEYLTWESQEIKLNELRSQLEELSKTLEENENAHQIEMAKTSDLFTRLKACGQELYRVKAEHVSAMKSFEKCGDELRERLKHSEEERVSLRSKLRIEHDRISRKSQEYESNLSKMQKEYEDRLGTVEKKYQSQLSKAKSKHESSVSELHHQIIELSQCKEELQRKNDVSQNNYVTNLNTLNTVKNALRNLKNEYSQSQCVVEEVEAQNNELKILVSQLSDESTSKEIEWTRQRENLEKRINSLEKEKSSLCLQLDELHSFNNEREILENEHLSELQTLRMELSNMSQEFQSVKSELKAKLENEEKEITENNSEMSKMLDTIEELQINWNEEKKDHQSLKITLSTLNDECNQVESQRTQITELKAELVQLNEEKQSNEKRLLKTIEERKTDSESYQSQAYEVNRRLEMKTEEVGELKKKMSSLLEAKFSIAFESQKTDLESRVKPNDVEVALKTENRKLKDDNLSESNKLGTGNRDEHTLGEVFGKEITNMRNEMELRAQNQLANQKARYQSRMTIIAEEISKQYQEKIEQLIKAKDAEIELAKGCSDETEVSSEKQQMAEFSKSLTEKSKEFISITKKYNATKNVIMKLKEEKEALLKKIESLTASPSSSIAQSLEIEQLKRHLKKLKTENRQLSIQFSAAETKIRDLQKTSESSEPKGKETFKVPVMPYKDTPGRSKAGRTRSEIHIHSRRPPFGSGALFNIDDEDGESFSNSYLAEIEDKSFNSNSTLDDRDRLSELKRRNILQPAHLKSSYPIETQFYTTDSFKEEDLLEGKGEEGEAVLSLTLGPECPKSKPSRSKPLRPHSIIGIYKSTTENSPSTNTPSRKRRNTSSSFALHANTFYINDDDGQPPAKDSRLAEEYEKDKTNKNHFEEEEVFLPSISSHESKSPVTSSKTLKSFLSHTPFKIKSMVQTALGTKKSYNVKLQQEGRGISTPNLKSPLILNKKKATTKKQLVFKKK